MDRSGGITYRIGDDELPSEAVVRATAAFTDASVIDLDPLFEVVDPDHFDGLFDDPGENAASYERSLTFDFNGCRVRVTPDAVDVRDGDDVPD